MEGFAGRLKGESAVDAFVEDLAEVSSDDLVRFSFLPVEALRDVAAARVGMVCIEFDRTIIDCGCTGASLSS